MGRVTRAYVKVIMAMKKNEDCNVGGNNIDLFEDSGLLLFDLVHKGIDSTNLGVVTGGDNKTDTSSLGN